MTDQQILTRRGELAEINGTLGVTVFGDVDGTMQTVLSADFTGQVPVALAWLTGDFLGLGNTQIAEPWDNNGALALTVFGDVDGTLQVPFVGPDMGQGSSALAWLAGDFTGSGSTEIAQPWDNNGTLEMIIYGNANGTIQTVFAGPMNQSSAALAWLTGNFTGPGNTQIAETSIRVSV